MVDTHALVWFLEGNPRLGANAKAVLDDPNADLVVPIIVLAEACWMIEHGRTSIPTPADLLTSVDADPRVGLAPLDRAVLERTLTLTEITEMHDRQIVATALVLRDQGKPGAVLTKDSHIHASSLVSVVW